MSLWVSFFLKFLWDHMLLSDAISPVMSPWFVGNCCDGSRAFIEINRIQSSPRKHLLNNAQRETAALLINRNKELNKSIDGETSTE